MREGRKEDPYDSLCVLRVIFATFAVKSFSSNGTQSVRSTFVWCPRNASSTSDAFADADAKAASDLFLRGGRRTHSERRGEARLIL
jgi:hypothetical protein